MAPEWGGCRNRRAKVALATGPRLNLPDTMYNQPARLFVVALLQADDDRRQLCAADLGQLDRYGWALQHPPLPKMSKVPICASV